MIICSVFSKFSPLPLLLLLLLAGLHPAAFAAHHGAPQDSIPVVEYQGYRLYLTHFEQIKEKKGLLYLQLSAINTGNQAMPLGKGPAQIIPVVSFDPSVEQAGLAAYQEEIFYALLEEKMTIPIGAIRTKIELRIEPGSKKTLAEPALAVKSPPPPQAEAPEMETLSAATQAPVANTPPTLSKEPLAQEASPAAIPVVEEAPAEESCSDLVLQNIQVLKRRKNTIVLEYQLTNRGFGKAPVVVGRKKEQQGLAIRANLSSTEKLTRGAIPLGGIFLEGDELTLASGESYTGTLKLDLHKLTKFTPILILELDAYEFVDECNEENNLSTLLLLEEDPE